MKRWIPFDQAHSHVRYIVVFNKNKTALMFIPSREAYSLMKKGKAEPHGSLSLDAVKLKKVI